ncbi:MAG: NUMOD4 motif-containing HNH endonuclease [Eubacterium sp.]|jgi:hypothetical protein|nr:NUMOD4 motif-containing HNH endonuclease [Eubacterium sp.]
MEIFVPVEGYNGRYLISNQGNMKCRPRSRSKKDYVPLKGWIDKHGYRRVDLNDGDEWLVHRLVALHFIPNPLQKYSVNHKNEDKLDNRVENLEWMSLAENTNYGSRTARAAESQKKPILRLDKHTGVVLQRYPCLQAAVAEGYNHSAVSRCANGMKVKSSGGFLWKWE